MQKRNVKNNSGTAAAVAREVYDAKVGIEALARSGKNSQLKGVVHEILVRDSINSNPANWIAGKQAHLAKSTTAVRDDLLIKQGSRIVGRMQLKDTPASISKTIQQVKQGKYAGSKLVGTKETVQQYTKQVANASGKGVKITQKMSSSGISSSETSTIAGKVLGSSGGKLAANNIAKVAGSSGVVGAAISGGIEIVSSGIKLAEGEIDGCEFTKNVARETAGGGISAAGASAAATMVTTGVAGALAAASAPIWIAPAIGIATATAVGIGIKAVWDSLWCE